MKEFTDFDKYTREDGGVVEFALDEGARELLIRVKTDPSTTYAKIYYFYQPLFGDGESVRYALAQMYAQGFKRADLIEQEIRDNG